MFQLDQWISWNRLWGLLVKEWNQLRRDHSTFVLILGIPFLQLMLFGFAINTNPKHLPIAVIDQDDGPFSRTLVQALENTQYFNVRYSHVDEKTAEKLIDTNQVLFVLNIPSDFSSEIVRGHSPIALLDSDGTNPLAVSYAQSAAATLTDDIFRYDLKGVLQGLQRGQSPAHLETHIRYNPEAISQYSVVPGLMGVVLTITLVLVTAMAITRERERGTIEGLLMTPVLPLEVIIGKCVPYVVVGYIQALFILVLAVYLFHVPVAGNILILLLATFPFIIANLFVGMTFSTLAKTQLEASQACMFYYLPSILLSGFAFPFPGMPTWAQWIGTVLPMTHYINITRGVMLKGVGFSSIWPDLWPILVFMLVMLFISVKRYRQTLD